MVAHCWRSTWTIKAHCWHTNNHESEREVRSWWLWEWCLATTSWHDSMTLPSRYPASVLQSCTKSWGGILTGQEPKSIPTEFFIISIARPQLQVNDSTSMITHTQKETKLENISQSANTWSHALHNCRPCPHRKAKTSTDQSQTFYSWLSKSNNIMIIRT